MVEIRWESGYARGLTITARGHAEGSPECCAAISALLGAWSTVCDERNGDVMEEPGEYRGHCKDGVEQYAAFRCILNGLRRLEEAGAEFVHIDNRPV